MYKKFGPVRREAISEALSLVTPGLCPTSHADFMILGEKIASKHLPAKEIIQYWHKIHPTVCFSRIHSRKVEEAFLCLAAMHDRVDIFECRQPLSSLSTYFFNPLTVAVYHRNIELIKLLVKAGYPSDQHARDLFGIFSIDINSAMDCALMADDVEVMSLLLPAVKSNSQQELLNMVKLNKAEKCFLDILMKMDPRNAPAHVYVTAFAFGVKVFEEMKRMGFEDFAKPVRSQWDGGTILHFAPYFCSDTGSLSSILNFLISQGARADKFNCRQMLAFDVIIARLNPENVYNVADVAEFRQKFHYLLDATEILLGAMRRERDVEELLVPCASVCGLQNRFYTCLICLVKTNDQFNQDVANLHLDICINMMEMTLVAGVDLASDAEVPFDLHSLRRIPMPRGTHPYLNFHSWLIKVNLVRNHTKIQVYEKAITRMNLLLLVYGIKPDQSCFRILYHLLEYNRPFTTMELVLPILGLMSAEDIHLFRKHVADTNAEQNKNVDVSLVSEHFCKSLRELCRCVLYNHIKHRRMAAHVNSLPLPNQLKDYLCLGYKIKDIYSQRFGVQNGDNLSERMRAINVGNKC